MTKSEKTRQFIIERSAPIINKKGMAGTALSDVMKATKLAKGGIYGHFASKDQICLETFDHLTSKISKALDAITSTEETARKKLHALLNYYGGTLATSDTGGCPLLNFGIEADDTSPEVKTRVARIVKKSQQRMANLIKLGQSSGEFRKGIDADQFAIKMFTMIEGGIFASRVTNNSSIMQTVVNILKTEIDEF